MRPNCPTPRKRAFETVYAAANRLMSLNMLNPKARFETYECKCGFVHLTNKGNKRIEV